MSTPLPDRRRLARALHIALCLGAGLLACAQPRPGSDTSDAAPAPAEAGIPAADGAAAPPDGATSDSPRPDGPVPDGPRPPDAPLVLDGPPAPCRPATDDCGLCRQCQAGSCVPIPNGQADDTGPTFCGDVKRCDGQGSCRSQLGQVCGRSEECLSGFCRSSVCCDSDCAGTCRHCLMPGRAGTCIDVTVPTYAIGCSSNAEICVAANRCLGPDQSCTQPLTDQNLQGDPIAQTFTVGRAGRLVAVRLSLVCQEGQQVTLEIHALTGPGPDGRLLATQTLRGPTPLADAIDERWLVPLATPIPVRTGDRMSMIVRFPGPSICALTMTQFACYPGGQRYTFTGDPAAWVPAPDSDLGFRTFVAD